MMPVDLSHAGRLEQALKVGADIAKLYGATITYVGITGPQPSSVAHTPQEYEQKLKQFADDQGSKNGVKTAAKAIVAHDPAVEIDHMLIDAAEEIGADLIVAGTHDPHAFDWPSHGGKLATHSHVSVMLVRTK
jgi:nucleotide-binding universal stress UspA family protein